MGTRMAPLYANLFMGKLRREFVQIQDKTPWVWWRYIDNIFANSARSEPSLQVFINNLRRHRPTVKFTASWSADEVTIYDMWVCLRNGLIGTGLIGTDLRVKPTDTRQYLQMDSCHAHHCKISIPYSQALRLRRIYLEQSQLQKWTGELKKHLLKRKYWEQQLNTESHQAHAVSRRNCLQQHLNQDKAVWIPLVVTYNPILSTFKSVTKCHLLTLHTSERLRGPFCSLR